MIVDIGKDAVHPQSRTACLAHHVCVRVDAAASFAQLVSSSTSARLTLPDALFFAPSICPHRVRT